MSWSLRKSAASKEGATMGIESICAQYNTEERTRDQEPENERPSTKKMEALNSNYKKPAGIQFTSFEGCPYAALPRIKCGRGYRREGNCQGLLLFFLCFQNSGLASNRYPRHGAK